MSSLPTHMFHRFGPPKYTQHHMMNSLILSGNIYYGLAVVLIAVLPLVYLLQLNRLLNGTPEEAHKLSPTRWTRSLLWETYKRLEEEPITTNSYVDRLPPRLDRRYIVAGGSGM